MTLRAIQPNPSYDMLLMRLALPPLKVDAAADDDDDDDDDADDDGRVGIWKAPLPDGTAELKMVICDEVFSINVEQIGICK